MLLLPTRSLGSSAQLFIDDELFFDQGVSGLSINRFSVGQRLPLWKNGMVGLSYVRLDLNAGRSDRNAGFLAIVHRF